MSNSQHALERVAAFCSQYELRIPILMAPMAGACPPAAVNARRSKHGASDINRMQSWAGQSAMYAQAKPASQIVTELWNDAQALLYNRPN